MSRNGLSSEAIYVAILEGNICAVDALKRTLDRPAPADFFPVRIAKVLPQISPHGFLVAVRPSEARTTTRIGKQKDCEQPAADKYRPGNSPYDDRLPRDLRRAPRDWRSTMVAMAGVRRAGCGINVDFLWDSNHKGIIAVRAVNVFPYKIRGTTNFFLTIRARRDHGVVALYVSVFMAFLTLENRACGSNEFLP